MATAYTGKDSSGIAHYEALKTAIANGETSLVEQLLQNRTMQALEKDYLIDLARLNDNESIIALLKSVPLKD
jgi:hypothetical protein